MHIPMQKPHRIEFERKKTNTDQRIHRASGSNKHKFKINISSPNAQYKLKVEHVSTYLRMGLKLLTEVHVETTG